ncbi:hypothetical protein CHUAL_007297 [Chamberlinius hualienensis]
MCLTAFAMAVSGTNIVANCVFNNEPENLEDVDKVLSWLNKKGEETLNKHSVVANSLGGVKAQERDFEKFYFLAMRNIEKGNDLLEEATVLGQKGTSESVGMKELASSLKQHLGSFSSRLEEQREKLEDTSKCYQLLDKAYEWALEAMKFVSRLKMDQCMTSDQLSCLMKHLHNYLDNHQPLGDETFVEMIELASKLSNERLLEQCKVAQMRCQETAELIRTRQQTLLKVKQQMDAETSRHRQIQQEQLLDQVSEASVARSCKDYLPSSAPLWTPFATSSPCYPYARRRSMSGLPYNLGSPPVSFFGVPCQPSHKRHDSLGAKMLISEEQDENGDSMDSGLMCNDIIPHADDDCFDVSSQTTCDKKSAEKNHCPGSSDSGNSLNDSKTTDVSNSRSDAEVTTPNSSMSSGPTCGKKIMKRSLTWQFEDDSWDILPARSSCGYGQLTKALPHRGSAESIPSITENEDSGLNQSSLKLGSGYPPVPVNSHLHQRGSSLNLQFAATSMADLRPSSDQLKQRKTALLIMREMIQTERDYVKSLEYIIENYVPELLRDDIPQALRGKRNVIFGNIEKIYEFHNRYFLQELEQCENSPSLVGQCFLYHDSHFYLYALYNKNKPNSDTLMAEYGSSFFKSKQLELGDKMDLASYLLKPVQRMGKYSLLLKQLLKECSEKDPEYSTLTAAKDMVNFQLRHGNDLLAMDALRECDVNLKEQGCLIRQDEFLAWQGKSRKCLRQVFLFEDLILFSKARRDPTKKGHDIYQYKSSFKMSDIGLTEQVGDSPTKFEIWFRKRKISDTYTLQAPTPDIRHNWIQDISKLLWKQALRNREIRLAEMSSMGIGNKPCLDIKPSEDQISDRSISISQLNRTAPKFKSPCGSVSSDFSRSNKRPHSIISVSSSSSGSSHSSSGPYFGALNLGFDPSDSPKSHHRSVTQQSQCSSESGIIPDISMNYYSLTDSERHSKVERSNSNTSNDSIGVCSLSRSPSTPMSPEEEEEDEVAVEVDTTIETVD